MTELFGIDFNIESIITMNDTFASPMLGDSSSMREVAGAYVMGVPDSDEVLVPNSFAPPGNENMSSDLLATAIDSYTSGINMHKPVGDGHFVTAPQPEDMVCRAPSYDDNETIIKWERLGEGQYHEFQIPGNGKTHWMKDDLFIAMPNKDIPIKVVGAQGGYVVEVGMRYTTGVHHDTPVLACKTHDDNDKAGFPFHVPKLHVVKMKDHGHPTVKIPVPNNGSDEGTFTFSVVFWCLNSCHRKYGKGQEMILKLYDMRGNLLKEARIKLRICKNVNRDKNLEGQSPKQGKKKRSSGGKAKEVQEGGEGVQTGETETPTPLQLLSPCQANLQVRCDPALVPTLREFVKALSRVVWIEMEEVVDGASPDPPPNME
ncbi:uncharacterized protein LOC126985382 isoform X2 [Eriocheir sinensis]|uniref:uncharacterized protein LOC126985382 isoform X2 n=1 Tax=Eriocheir sinensis TaxID=95602 RepID=UPI0021C5AF5E|nr:uncharacterized protein LOC126985382 isoform X2 [Eriocheir sinensis]